MIHEMIETRKARAGDYDGGHPARQDPLPVGPGRVKPGYNKVSDKEFFRMMGIKVLGGDD